MSTSSSASIGLQLKDRTIQRISGPVSIFYLKPTATSLPLILLFGDVHSSTKEMCTPCACTSEGACCSLLHDTPLLEGLDRIAEEYPVDFFSEQAKFDNYNNPDLTPLNQFRYHTQGCYEVSKRSTVNYTCPTRSIRWHYADLRYTSNKIEAYLIHTYRRVLDSFIKNLPPSTTTPSKWGAYIRDRTGDYKKFFILS